MADIRNAFMYRKAQGERIQEVVKRHLERRGVQVKDVSLVKDYQKIDIDFIITDRQGNKATLEIKNDNSITRTQNIFLEASHRCSSGKVTQGWLKYCQAQFLCVYDEKARRGYVFDFHKLKQLSSTFGIQRNFFDKEDNKVTTAILLPLQIATDNKALIHTWNE